MDNTIGKEITILVRSPSLNETLQIKTALNATILTLKKSIESVHPHHPKSTSQRIIYSGKLLKDSDILAEVLKKIDEEVTPTFHLVVKPSLDVSTSSTRSSIPATAIHSRPSHQQQQQQQHQEQQQQQSQSESQQPPYYYQPSSSSSSFSEGVPPNSCFAMPQYPEQPPMYPSSLPGGYQVVCINGQYYLAPTLVLAQNLLPQQSLNTHILPTAQSPIYQNQADVHGFTMPQPHLPQQQQREPIVQPYINQIPPQQQQNHLFFGGNGPILARPANIQRAASIWLALKLIVVLFMVCQGASIERIFIFHAIAFIFFLYQTGRLRFVLRRVRVEDLNRFRQGGGELQQQPVAGGGGTHTPPPTAPNTDGVAEGASTSVNNSSNNLTQRRQQDNGEGSVSNQDASSGSNTTATEPARPLTALDVWKRGVYTFFASLWPTYGVDPQIAQAFQNGDNNQEQQQRD